MDPTDFSAAVDGIVSLESNKKLAAKRRFKGEWAERKCVMMLCILNTAKRRDTDIQD